VIGMAGFRAIIALLCGLMAAAPAAAVAIDLHPHLCISASAQNIAQIARGAYRIAACQQPPRDDGWTWLRLTASPALAPLPADWRLLIDENRFDRIVVTATAHDGSVQRIERTPDTIGRDWAPGNALLFTIHSSGADLAALNIGFERLDGALFIRQVTALDAAAERLRSDRWLLLIGLFVGAVVSALAYNIVLYLGQRYRFQRWYVVWACTVLAYGAWWTSLLGFVSPLLIGPRAVRMESALLGLVVGSATMVLLNLLEPHALSRRLVTIGRVQAGAAVVLGIVAALDHIVPPVASDRLLNAVLGLNAAWVLATVAVAIRRNSQIIWFYLAGWLPVLSVFMLRLARNFGLLPQSDTVDMATFAAIALESIILSVTIAYRFRYLRRERDAANRAIAAMTVEADTLRRAAQTDFLTTLGNRAAFQTALDAIAPDTALFLIDLDHLKEVNDSYGHQFGDALLIHVADRLRAVVPDPTVLARIGGDEFAILLPEAREQAVGEAIDRLQGEPWVFGGRSLSLSFSVGHARTDQDRPDAATLYQQADFALYRAKNLGRGRRHRYDPALARLLDLETRLMAEAPRALAAGEFLLYYQPIIYLADERQVGAEALLRWNHPEHGLLTPESFASLLVDESIGPMIQDQVLALALHRLAEHDDGLAYISVNFTGVQLRGAGAAQHILDRLDRADIPARRLCVELTEGIVLDRSAGEIAEALHLLHAAGVRIALDDFGTGYASLIHLQRIPVDILKIDCSFVSMLDKPDDPTREIVRSILSLGTALHKTVIAEGIETDAQLAELRNFGCPVGQGYLFATPGPSPVMPQAKPHPMLGQWRRAPSS
jgi:diguanylate cyclase (GGDEF)-like protein